MATIAESLSNIVIHADYLLTAPEGECREWTVSELGREIRKWDSKRMKGRWVSFLQTKDLDILKEISEIASEALQKIDAKK
jgi:hypothetical protein